MLPVIKAVGLSREGYAPFGQFVCAPEGKPDIEDSIVKYWANLAGFEIDQTIDIGWVTMKRRPFVLDQLERHFHTVEVVIPLDDELLLPVAFGRQPFDYQSKPCIEDIRAFILRPGQLVTFTPGTWHFGGFPLNRQQASFLVLTKRGTAASDVSMQSLPEPRKVEFSL